MTAEDRLEQYLKTHASITSKQIRDKLGVGNAPDAVYKLRRKKVWHVRKGVFVQHVCETPYWTKLKTTMIKAKNRYGETVRVASYSLLK